MEGTDAVLDRLRQKGVRLWSQDGQLRYQAPRGILTKDDLDRLKSNRSQILVLLSRVSDPAQIKPRSLYPGKPDCAPLAYSQLAHWQSCQLGEWRSMRHITSVVRLRGKLMIDSMRSCLAELVRRHDALRTRIVVVDAVPVQEIVESIELDFDVIDLSEIPEHAQEAEIRRVIDEFITLPIDPSVDALFGAQLIRLSGEEHVLILGMEHIISDAFSMKVLLRDLFDAYARRMNGSEVPHQAPPLQFADYALWQRASMQSWLDTHGAYWTERASEYGRLSFPNDDPQLIDEHRGWAIVPFQIDGVLKRELQEWSQKRGTTLVMTVFTAYAALTLLWCNAAAAIIPYQSDGRTSPEYENTIGYFAMMFYLRVSVEDGDSFIDLISRNMREYCRAYEHADFGYLEAQVPRPEFTKNGVFNWMPRGTTGEVSDPGGTRSDLEVIPVAYTNSAMKTLELDGEPSLALTEEPDVINCGMYFPQNRLSPLTMERFAGNLLWLLRELLRTPEGKVKDIPLI